MIIDLVDKLDAYSSINKNLLNGLKKLKETEIVYGENIEFEGGFLFFQKGQTNPLEDGLFEAHRKYLDVQVVLEGSEYVAWAPINELQEEVAYDDVKDKILFDGEPKTVMNVQAGMGYVCLPTDGHKALKHLDEVTDYVKAVIKLEV